MMLRLRRISSMGCWNPDLRDTIRTFSTETPSLRNSVASILDLMSLKPGGTLVHNSGDSDVGKIVIQLAKERELHTISIIEDKRGNPETIEDLKALGGDIVVPESYTKTWYMKRLVNELTPTAGINLAEGYQATAVGNAVAKEEPSFHLVRSSRRMLFMTVPIANLYHGMRLLRRRSSLLTCSLSCFLLHSLFQIKCIDPSSFK